MSFAINPALNHLDIPEKYVVDIYQSTAEVVLPDARFRGHPCEAYICITRVEKDMKAYVALLNNALKSTLVYTSDFVAKTTREYPGVLAEAEEYVSSMGFTMQKINLDFSPAMREVIIKGLRVMRPPAPQRRAPVRPLKIDVPQDLVDSTGLDEYHPGESGMTADINTMTELLSLKSELASARAALERVTREKVAAEQQNSSERGALKAACEQAVESRRLAEERLEQAVRDLKKLEQASPRLAESHELQRLQQQLDHLTANASAAEKVREQLQSELHLEREKVTLLEGEKGRFEQRLVGEAEKLSTLRGEAAELKRQLEEQLAIGAEAAAKMAAMAVFEQSWREAEQREEELRGNAAAIEEELARARSRIGELLASKSQAEEFKGKIAGAMAELAAAREQLAASAAEIKRLRQEQNRTDELLQRLDATETELATARGEIERLEKIPAAGMEGVDHSAEEELARLAGEKEAVEAEYVRLATESREKEIGLAESLSLAEAEIARLGSELEIQGQVAAMEQAALRTELRRLIVEGGAAFHTRAAEPLQPIETPATSPPPAHPHSRQAAAPPRVATPRQPHPVPAPEPQPAGFLPEIEEEDESPDAPIVSDTAILQKFTSDLGGFYGGGGASTTEFRIDPSIETISYSDPAEVAAVFYSSNSVQAVPDGKGIQRCKGYIVAMKSPEGYRVYVAWHLTESGRVVVCLPEQQPQDSDECVQILKDAVSYFEIVGFMMEVADLGGTRQSYRKALRKIPALKKVSPRE